MDYRGVCEPPIWPACDPFELTPRPHRKDLMHIVLGKKAAQSKRSAIAKSSDRELHLSLSNGVSLSDRRRHENPVAAAIDVPLVPGTRTPLVRPPARLPPAYEAKLRDFDEYCRQLKDERKRQQWRSRGVASSMDGDHVSLQFDDEVAVMLKDWPFSLKGRDAVFAEPTAIAVTPRTELMTTRPTSRKSGGADAAESKVSTRMPSGDAASAISRHRSLSESTGPDKESWTKTERLKALKKNVKYMLEVWQKVEKVDLSVVLADQEAFGADASPPSSSALVDDFEDPVSLYESRDGGFDEDESFPEDGRPTTAASIRPEEVWETGGSAETPRLSASMRKSKTVSWPHEEENHLTRQSTPPTRASSVTPGSAAVSRAASVLSANASDDTAPVVAKRTVSLSTFRLLKKFTRNYSLAEVAAAAAASAGADGEPESGSGAGGASGAMVDASQQPHHQHRAGADHDAVNGDELERRLNLTLTGAGAPSMDVMKPTPLQLGVSFAGAAAASYGAATDVRSPSGILTAGTVAGGDAGSRRRRRKRRYRIQASGGIVADPMLAAGERDADFQFVLPNAEDAPPPVDVDDGSGSEQGEDEVVGSEPGNMEMLGGSDGMSNDDLNSMSSSDAKHALSGTFFRKFKAKHISFAQSKSSYRPPVEASIFSLAAFVSMIRRVSRLEDPKPDHSKDKAPGAPKDIGEAPLVIERLGDFLETPYTRLKDAPVPGTPAYAALLQTISLALRSEVATQELRFEAARLMVATGAHRRGTGLARWDAIYFRFALNDMLKRGTPEEMFFAAVELIGTGAFDRRILRVIIGGLGDVDAHRRHTAIEVLANVDHFNAAAVIETLLLEAGSTSWKVRIDVIELLERWCTKVERGVGDGAAAPTFSHLPATVDISVVESNSALRPQEHVFNGLLRSGASRSMLNLGGAGSSGAAADSSQDDDLPLRTGGGFKATSTTLGKSQFSLAAATASPIIGGVPGGNYSLSPANRGGSNGAGLRQVSFGAPQSGTNKDSLSPNWQRDNSSAGGGGSTGTSRKSSAASYSEDAVAAAAAASRLRRKSMADAAVERERRYRGRLDQLVSRVVEALLNMMWNDWSKDVKAAATAALAKLGRGDAVFEWIVGLLDSPHSSMRVDALKCLEAVEGVVPPTAVAGFLNAFSDMFATVRLEACKLARRFVKPDDRVMINTLLERFADSDERVRTAAVEAIGYSKCCEPRICESLHWCLNHDSSPSVRIEAVRAAASLGLLLRDPTIRESVLMMSEMDRSAEVRREAERKLIDNGGLMLVLPSTASNSPGRSGTADTRPDEAEKAETSGRADEAKKDDSPREQGGATAGAGELSHTVAAIPFGEVRPTPVKAPSSLLKASNTTAAAAESANNPALPTAASSPQTSTTDAHSQQPYRTATRSGSLNDHTSPAAPPAHNPLPKIPSMAGGPLPSSLQGHTRREVEIYFRDSLVGDREHRAVIHHVKKLSNPRQVMRQVVRMALESADELLPGIREIDLDYDKPLPFRHPRDATAVRTRRRKMSLGMPPSDGRRVGRRVGRNKAGGDGERKGLVDVV
ncbi:hypothetical protein DFJ73DRAFT_955603 [Zopfochytrium polystomum]|nr:hypothetical protein DFJ73DRAFT_955603 [Zopfochytrium polystomum]